MKKLLVVLLTVLSSATFAQSINCGSFCVLSINNLDTIANTVDVTIWNGDTNSVNYPTITVVDGLGDTVANKTNYFYLFLHTAGDTLTQTIPSDWDSIPAGFTGTVYLRDQIWDTACAFAYPMPCTVGINEYASSNALMLYPNPADELFHLGIKGMKGSQISLYNMTGQIVRSINAEDDEITIPREDLSAGIYFIEAKVRGKRLTQKVVLR